MLGSLLNGISAITTNGTVGCRNVNFSFVLAKQLTLSLLC